MEDFEQDLKLIVENVSGFKVKAADCQMDELLVNFGLSSMQIVMLITTFCEQADVDMESLTEKDIYNLQTLSDVIKLTEKSKEA